MKIKKCYVCGQAKPLEKFYSDKSTKDGKMNRCKKCDKARSRIQNRIQRGQDIQKKQKIKKIMINKSINKYNELLKKQNNRCAICGIHFSETDTKHFSVDHNHHTGEIRGLLCGKCNIGISNFNEDIPALKKAIMYLSKY